MGDLSQHFSRSEFECKCGQCRGYDTVDSELLNVLERLRVFYGKPITINSGHRCPEHNKAIGGSKNSQHLLGRAADIDIVGIAPYQVQDILFHWYPDKYGIGCYSNFTHIDTRSWKSRW